MSFGRRLDDLILARGSFAIAYPFALGASNVCLTTDGVVVGEISRRDYTHGFQLSSRNNAARRSSRSVSTLATVVCRAVLDDGADSLGHLTLSPFV